MKKIWQKLDERRRAVHGMIFLVLNLGSLLLFWAGQHGSTPVIWVLLGLVAAANLLLVLV